VSKKDRGDFTRGSTNLLQIALKLRSRFPNACVDQTDLVTEKDIRINKPVCIIVLAKGQPERVLKGMDRLCDFHPRFLL
jgi:hypothetical protein